MTLARAEYLCRLVKLLASGDDGRGYSRSSGSRLGPTLCMVSKPFSTMSQ